MKVALHTLGCKLNFSETSTISRSFSERGFEQVPFNEVADVYVLNTCSVTENADRKCRKFVRQVLRQNEEAFVIVMGCYAQLKPTEISEIEGVDLVLGAKEKFNLFEHIDDFTKPHSCKVIAGEIGEVNEFKHAFSAGDRTRSFLKIQDGCDYKCSFCTIPLARGTSRSDKLENIIANAQKIAELGVKEVVLTGVNIGDYGKGMDDKFIDVVKALDEVAGIDRIRISSIEPNLLTDEIIEFVAHSKRFMPHFHVPLQSGNDEMLKVMRRRYKSGLYSDRVRKIRELMPDASIGVDVIVGFPGESDEHFANTVEFLKEIDVTYFHVFTFSERLNTVAAEMENQVPMNVRHERSATLRNLSEKKRRAFYERFVGEERPVLWEAIVKDGRREGFTDNYLKVELEENLSSPNEIGTVRLGEVNAAGNMKGSVLVPTA